MAKRNWPDHEAVGLTITVDGHDFKIMDAKCGPMWFNPDDLNKNDVEIHGTIKLRVKPVAGGAERRLPPIDGKQLCEWADSQRAIAAAPKLAGGSE